MKLTFGIQYCGLAGKPGYSCLVELAPDDRQSKWSRAGRVVGVDNLAPRDPAQPDRIVITTGNSVSLDFSEAQSGSVCGAGAELPEALVIPATGGKCRVWLAKP